MVRVARVLLRPARVEGVDLGPVGFGILLVPGLYALFQTWRERVKRLFAYLSARAARKRSLKDRSAG